jgi:formiminotetrahydrofolate cyclodeaminase
MADDPAGGFSALRVHELLAAVADRTPAPGGGAVAALAAALAASLTAMAARFSADPGTAEVAVLADELRSLAAPLADDDAAAYQRVLAATGLPREPDPGTRREAIRRALDEASDVPLRVAEIGAEVAALAAALARSGNPNLRGDAAAAALLGAAAATTAAILVAENLAKTPDDPRIRRARELAASVRSTADATLRLFPAVAPA